MDKIILRDMKIFGYTGCLPQEKENGQYFYITCELNMGKIKGASTDRLEDTADYSMLYRKIKATVEHDRSNLIEHLASKIADTVMISVPACSLCRVTVKKPDAPIDGEFDCMEVVIEKQR